MLGSVTYVPQGPRSPRLQFTGAVRVILVLVGTTIPLTDVLAINSWTPVPLLIGMAAFGVSAWRGWLSSIDLCLAGLFLLMLAPFIAWPEYLGDRSLRHIAGLAVSFVAYYYGTRFALSGTPQTCVANLLALERGIAIGLFGASVYIIVEVLAINVIPGLGGLLFDHVSPREYDVMSLLGAYQRPQGLGTEAGISALHYEFAVPVVLLSTRKRWSRAQAWLYWSVVALAFMSLFSITALVALPFALAVYLLRDPLKLLKWLAVSVTLGAAAIAALPGNLGALVREVAWGKLTFTEGASAIDRLDRYGRSFAVILEYPLGIGFGSAAQLSSEGLNHGAFDLQAGQVSLALTIALSGGIPALVLAFVIIVKSVRDGLRVKSPFSVALCGLAIHHLFVSEYWLPFLWVALAATHTAVWTSQSGRGPGRGGNG